MYLVSDTVITNDAGQVSAAIVYPRVSFISHNMDTGKHMEVVSSYNMMQQISIAKGEVLLDRSDTNYWLYPVFEYFEKDAKKHNAGYWGQQESSR